MSPTTWRELLNSISVSDFVKSQGPRKVVSVNTETKAHSALKLLSENGILSVPVWDDARQAWVAFLDMVDLVSLAARMFEEKRGIGDFYAVAINNAEFNDKSVGDVIGQSNRNPFIPVDVSADSLAEVCSILATRGAHRVPVMQGKDLISIITQSQVVNFVHAKLGEISHINTKSVRDLELGVYRDIVTVHEDAKALQAFRLMDYARVSGVAVVDDDNQVLSVLSVKDLRVIADPKEDRVNFEDLLVSTREFVVKAHDPAHLGHKVTANELQARHPMASCVHDQATFQQVVNKLHLTAIHRVFILNNNNQPIGCVALRDVLRVIAKN